MFVNLFELCSQCEIDGYLKLTLSCEPIKAQCFHQGNNNSYSMYAHQRKCKSRLTYSKKHWGASVFVDKIDYTFASSTYSKPQHLDGYFSIVFLCIILQ